MAKERISASIDITIVTSIKKFASKEKRSFSQMVEMLLFKALDNENKNKSK